MASLVIPDAELVQVDDLVIFRVKKAYRPELLRIYDKAGQDKLVHLTVGTRQHPKRTGEGTRLNLVHEWFGNIAEQLGMDPSHVKEAMKRMAVERGWPTCWNPIEGKEEPVGVTWASEENMKVLVEATKTFADFHGLWLMERVDGIPTPCVGGKPRNGGTE